MRFFFDRNMSPRLARMIGIYERDSTVVHHDDDGRFSPTTTDVEWIKTLAADDPPWIALSGDGRILRNKVELAALNEAKLTFFCMSKAWSHMDFHEYSWKFVKIWPLIVEPAKSPARRVFEVSGAKVDLVRLYR